MTEEEHKKLKLLLNSDSGVDPNFKKGQKVMKRDYEIIEIAIRHKIEQAQQRLLKKLDVKVLLTGCQHEDDIIDRLQDDFEDELDCELQPLLEEYLQLQATEAKDLQDTVEHAWRQAHGM